jgi:hypothetical protein
MNRIVIEWPKGMDLQLALLTSHPILSQSLVTSAPARFLYDPNNSILESIPLEDPTNDSETFSSGNGTSESDIENGDEKGDENGDDNMSSNSEDTSMDEDNSDDDSPDLVSITEIRI